MKVFLIGYRCTGKTSVGVLLSKLTGLSFLDTDHEIEKKIDMTISEFVKKHDWKDFREIEKNTLHEMIDKENVIISTGGGIILDSENRTFIKKHGQIIWLSAPKEIILKRMEQDNKTKTNRPSLSNKNIKQETIENLNLRNPLYKELADFHFDSSSNNIESIAKIINERVFNGRL